MRVRRRVDVIGLLVTAQGIVLPEWGGCQHKEGFPHPPPFSCLNLFSGEPPHLFSTQLFSTPPEPPMFFNNRHTRRRHVLEMGFRNECHGAPNINDIYCPYLQWGKTPPVPLPTTRWPRICSTVTAAAPSGASSPLAQPMPRTASATSFRDPSPLNVITFSSNGLVFFCAKNFYATVSSPTNLNSVFFRSRFF